LRCNPTNTSVLYRPQEQEAVNVCKGMVCAQPPGGRAVPVLVVTVEEICATVRLKLAPVTTLM
jgi:hypothetical protein